MKWTPRLAVLADQIDERLDLIDCDVLLQELAIIVQESCDCVLGENTVTNLLLHEREVLRDPFLHQGIHTMFLICYLNLHIRVIFVEGSKLYMDYIELIKQRIVSIRKNTLGSCDSSVGRASGCDSRGGRCAGAS